MGTRAGTFYLAALAAAGLAACDGGFLSPSKSGFAVDPNPIEFGPTALSLPKVRTLVLRNEGRAPYRVLGATVEGPWVSVEPFEPFQLDSGGTRELAVVFSPTAEGDAEGAVLVQTDTASAGTDNTARVRYSGQGVRAFTVLSPAKLDFGNLELGKVRSLELLASNPSSAEAPLRFVIEGADPSMFTSPQADQDLALAAGETRPIEVVFHADRLLAAAATVRVISCGDCTPQPITLEGFGINSIVEITPSRIDFGRVPLGARAEARILVSNQGTEPLDFEGVAWTVPPQYFAVEPVARQAIMPTESLWVTVNFTPQTTGTVPVSFLEVRVRAGNVVSGNWPMLPVKGEVGDSCIVVLPRSVDFGLVPEGMSATRQVDLLNRCGKDLVINDQTVAITSGGFFGLAKPAQPVAVPSGGKTPVSLVFSPKPGSGSSTARFGFKAVMGSSTSYSEVPLKGESHSFPPCQYTVAPTAVDYGLVALGAEVSLGAAFRNTGTNVCFLSSGGLVAGSDLDFSSDGLSSGLLNPGDTVVLSVKFKPHAVGSFSALGEVFLNGAGGHATVPFSGRGIQGCLQLTPANVAFGTTKLICPARSRTVSATNNCSGPVTVSSALIGSSTSPDFSLSSPPSFPLTLWPGAQTSFGISYQPADVGEDTAALLVEAGLGRPLSVGLAGRGVNALDQTDRFFQEGQTKVDLLFVVDNSGSFMEEQNGLSQNISAVLAAAQASGIDYHIGVTTTGIEPAPGGWAVCPGGAEGGEAGRLFPADGSSARWVTPTTPNGAQAIANNMKVGVCHWDEQGLEAAYRALSAPLVGSADDTRTLTPADGNLGFLRTGAKLAIIALSDEDDSSPQSVQFYETFFRGLKGGEASLFSFSAVVGPADLSTCPTAASSGTRYLQLAQATGGISESICTSNWAGSLQNLSANAFGPKARFPLSERPLDPAQVTVQINGLPVTSGWLYDPTTNSVIFLPGSAPATGSVIDVTYPLGC
ncbi:MAG: choice-of-anchor D domain-containing protein [Myxococcaceae bacterium]